MVLIHGLASVCCVVVFLFGLFPVSPRIDVSAAGDYSPGSSLVDRVVWIVIDALRGDFELLPIEGTSGVVFDCVAPSPTVTLPRLFALVTGSEPSFAQALRNFGGDAQLGEDSLISRWRDRRKVFYGDDTWLRLFPASSWTRSEGVTSFVVRDTVEVDDNVTRNVNVELERTDWDVMVLHFLGIDHVGHSLGPRHPRMREKLAEMRNVVSKVARALGPRDLIVVSGDHGMTEQGNHGGNSAQETSSQHLFLRSSPKNNISRVGRACHQADVTATLAELTGVAAPANCLGRPLEEAIHAIGGNVVLAMQRASHRLSHWARLVGATV
jgi:ethanolaminephosphotransferase